MAKTLAQTSDGRAKRSLLSLGAERPDPYSSFRSDRERRRALFARDVRLVLIALNVTVGGAMPASAVFAWLRLALA